VRWGPFLRCTDAFINFVSVSYIYLSIFAVMFPIYLLLFNSLCLVNVVAFIVA